MTKRKLKLKLKKWNSIGIRYETLRRKKSQTVVKDTKPKDQAEGFTEGGKKTFSGPTYDTSISHLDPMIYNCQHVRKFSE